MHLPTKMVYSHQDCQKVRHNTRRGVRHFNHWYNVYRCPVCGLLRAPGRKGAKRGKVCKGE